jgi:hypothetical protein
MGKEVTKRRQCVIMNAMMVTRRKKRKKAQA